MGVTLTRLLCTSAMAPRLENYTDEDQAILVGIPLDKDDDSGPAEALCWAHATKTKDAFYFLKDHRPLRQRGYVVWGLERLHHWNFSEGLWDMISRHFQDYPERLKRTVLGRNGRNDGNPRTRGHTYIYKAAGRT